jgi:lysophospholipase L1-like esterase
MKQDMREAPVRRLVLLGESNGFGMCAGDPRNEWFQSLAGLLRDFQDEPLVALNHSVPGCVISPRSPGYPGLPEGALPSALERYETEVIGAAPDLVVLAFGLNDSRCGNPVDAFIEDLEAIVADTQARTSALVVITSPYWNTQYNPALWKTHRPSWADDPTWAAFTREGDALVTSYVRQMRALAERRKCIFVDLYSLTEDCLWLMNQDQCHFNDVGHRVIGQAVFHAVASRCSFVGRKSIRQAAEAGLDVSNTGGTGATSRMVQLWLHR